jgi:coenzyme PQQ precursor peptide PqqA
MRKAFPVTMLFGVQTANIPVQVATGQGIVNPAPWHATSTSPSRQENAMKTKVWTRPEVKEVRLGCEINSYAPAEI